MIAKSLLRIVAPATIAAAAPADAAMTGLTASVREVSGHTMVDVYATFTSTDDRLTSARLQSLTTDAGGGFVQGSAPAVRGWAPDYGWTSTMDSVDSFLTVGGTDLGIAGGPTYANTTLSAMTAGAPSGTWGGTVASAPSNQLIMDPGTSLTWMSSSLDPLGLATGIGDLPGRIDILGNPDGSAYGVWLMHLVIAGTDPRTVTIGNMSFTWRTSAGISFNYPPILGTSASVTFAVPAPGAGALLAAAVAVRRRRR